MSELVPKIAFADELERALLGSVLIARDPHDVVAAVTAVHPAIASDLGNLRHVVLWRVFETLRDQLLPITSATVEHQLAKQGNLEAVGGVAFLGELALEGAPHDVALAHVPEIQTAAINRRAVQLLATAHERARSWPHDAAELVEETRADLGRLEQRLPGRRTYHTVEQVVAGMHRFAQLPWIPFALGGEVIAELPLGESLYLMGPSGSGKTTLAFCFATHHARHCGPVIIVSRELSEVTAGGRLGAMLSGASWSDVLRGRATEEAGRALLELPRLLFLDEDRTSFSALRRTIAEVKVDFPGEPIMVLVDYVQLLEASGRGGGELRLRTNDAVDELRRLILSEKLVGLVLSQMSRAIAREAKGGGRLGGDAGDGGAETSAIERAAAITAEIGRQVEVTEPGIYGAKDVQLSIGKGRYGGGDRVVELRQWGASGLTRVLRDEPAREVREREREVRERASASEKRSRTEAALMEAADRATAPFTRQELFASAGISSGRALVLARSVVDGLLKSGALVEIADRKARAKVALLWTRDRAAASAQSRGDQ